MPKPNHGSDVKDRTRPDAGEWPLRRVGLITQHTHRGAWSGSDVDATRTRTTSRRRQGGCNDWKAHWCPTATSAASACSDDWHRPEGRQECRAWFRYELSRAFTQAQGDSGTERNAESRSRQGFDGCPPRKRNNSAAIGGGVADDTTAAPPTRQGHPRLRALQLCAQPQPRCVGTHFRPIVAPSSCVCLCRKPVLQPVCVCVCVCIGQSRSMPCCRDRVTTPSCFDCAWPSLLPGSFPSCQPTLPPCLWSHACGSWAQGWCHIGHVGHVVARRVTSGGQVHGVGAHPHAPACPPPSATTFTLCFARVQSRRIHCTGCHG